MPSLTPTIDKTFYPTYQKNWDDALFRNEILKHIHPHFQILDLGAGAGIVAAMNFRGEVAKVCGVDLDPRVKENPFLDEGIVVDGKSIPYLDNTFDIVFADNVLEHLDKPEEVFNEVHRVLKPTGKFIIKTPNRRHYVPFIARMTPTWFHKFINRLRGRATDDTFPTVYKANSEKQLKAICQKTGLTVQSITLIEGRPEYLRFSALTYLCGLLYERIVNSHYIFRGYRVVMMAVMEKGEGARAKQ